MFLFRNHEGCLEAVRVNAEDEVLDLGTGTGLLGLIAARQGAKRVVATDINPAACANARKNAAALGFADRFEVRQVSEDTPGAYSVIGADERFDVILANPPFKNDRPSGLVHRATRDLDFEFLRSIVKGARAHLKEGGRLLLFQGFADGFRLTSELARENRLRVKVICPEPLGIDLAKFPDGRLFVVLFEIAPEEPS